MKKLLTFVVLSFITFGAYAQTFTSRGLTYKVISAANREVKLAKYNGPGGNVTIPSTVTGKNGVQYKVKSIGDKAFFDCSDLTSVTIPNSVTSIGNDAFSDCFSLASITIPKSVTSIGESAFFGCSGLTSVTIPNSVVSIGDNVFNGCYNMTSVAISNSVTSIGNRAFSGCIDLTSIYIPNNVVSIGNEAFRECGSLTSITIPNNVTSIGDWAFYDCAGLTSVTIPKSVTSIEGGIFCGSSVTNIKVESGNSVYDSRNNSNCIIETKTNKLIAGCQTTIIPNSVKSIGAGALSKCGLTNVTIPNSVLSIEENAFNWCLGLTNVTIGNSVTSIGDHAFDECSDLKSVTIGSSVTSIGEQAFSGCTNLTDVTCLAKNPPTLVMTLVNSTAYITPFWDSCDKLSTLHVLRGCKAAYERSNWKKFFRNIVEDAKPLDSNTSGSYGTASSLNAETTASFPGGETAMLNYINSHLKYPEIARNEEIQGKVVVKVAVLENGEVGDVQVVQSLVHQCDMEAIRVIKSLPRFSPAKKNGIPEKSWLTIPVRFTLSEK